MPNLYEAAELLGKPYRPKNLIVRISHPKPQTNPSLTERVLVWLEEHHEIAVSSASDCAAKLENLLSEDQNG